MHYRTKIKIKNRIDYSLNPKLCLYCSTPIEFECRLVNKFCNHSCRARFINPISRNTHCVDKGKLQKEKRLERFRCGEIHERPTLKKYLVAERGWSCELCEQSTWFGNPIPLEIDHINGFANNNTPDNLRLLCPNCHAIQPTSKGKNRGSGRKSLGLPTH